LIFFFQRKRGSESIRGTPILQVAIMVGGRFRCYGNVQRLKARFGQGFVVEVKLSTDLENETDEKLVHEHVSHCYKL
jgi:hypothetical protein